MITKYHSLTTEELLRMLSDRRSASPIIDELCNRVEAGKDLADDERLVNVTDKITCPVCAATSQAYSFEELK